MNRHIITIGVAVLSLGIGYTIRGVITPTAPCNISIPATTSMPTATSQAPAATTVATTALVKEEEEPIVLPEVSKEDAEAAFKKAEPLFLEKKYDDAITDLKIAAKGGVPYAEYFLGMSYQQGLGVEVDNVQAYYWLTLAQIHRLKSARAPMNKLSRSIKYEDKEKAKAMVQEWKVKQKAIQRSAARLAAKASK